MKRWLAIALALMTALQSLAAIGGMNELHHSAALHHVHEHEHSHELAVGSHNLDTVLSSIPADSSSDHASDHCHHNHAHFPMVLVSAVTDIAVLFGGQRPAGYLVGHASAIPSSLFRPPIA